MSWKRYAFYEVNDWVFSYEKEDKVACVKESIRQENEVNSLTDLKVPGTNITVKPDGYPTLTGQFLPMYFTRISVFSYKSSYLRSSPAFVTFW